MSIHRLPNGGYRTHYNEEVNNKIINPLVRQSKKEIYDLIEIQNQLDNKVDKNTILDVINQEENIPYEILEEAFNDLKELEKIKIENGGVYIND
jgi:hypothetical protein